MVTERHYFGEAPHHTDVFADPGKEQVCMAEQDWRKRLLESTRGRVLRRLRRAEQTVSELAEALGLTDNGVRLHLDALQRDGLVEQRGVRREGVGKPAYVYGTTPDAETLFPKAYEPVLNQLLQVLETTHSPEELERLVRETGKRLAAQVSNGAADLRGRTAYAAGVLTRLGGLAEVHEEPCGTLRLQGYSCPLAGITRSHESACKLAEALVQELVQAPVQECCDRGERPRCAFRVSAA